MGTAASSPAPSQLAPRIFISYTRDDDANDNGFVVKLSDKLKSEYRSKTGSDSLEVFTDTRIGWGQWWEKTLSDEIQRAVFLVPVVTPLFLESAFCRKEVEEFLQVEQARERDDLVLPILWLDTPALRLNAVSDDDPRFKVISAIRGHNYIDFRDVRLEDFSSPPMRRKISESVDRLREAVARVHSLPRSSQPRDHNRNTDANTHVVDPQSSAHFCTIREALNVAKPGDVLRLAPGVHQAQDVDVTVPVEIHGSSSGVPSIIETDGRTALRFTASSAALKHVTLRQTVRSSRSTVVCSGHRLLIGDCEFLGGGALACVECTHGECSIERTRLSNSWYGVLGLHGTQISMKSSSVTKTSVAAVCAIHSCRVCATECSLVHNGHAACVHSGGTLELIRCDVMPNDYGPLSKGETASIRLEDNSGIGNNQSG